MSQTTFLSPDRLYDRPWRSNHPFNRNLSAGRRWSMIAVFALLCSIIGGYLFVTDARRVKRLAETELGKLVGGSPANTIFRPEGSVRLGERSHSALAT